MALLCVLGCAPPALRPVPVAVSDGRYAMGTVLELTLYVGEREGDPLLEALFAQASDLERTLSRHDPESALSQLNRAAGQGAYPASRELRELLARARDETLRTAGAFDATVGPLVALWTEAAARDRLPDARALESARARVGPSRIEIGPDFVRLAPGSSLDLGGIAKGFALDRMQERLARQGIRSALLSFGQSSVWALGAPPGLEGWRLLVRGPHDEIAGAITLRDQALSVSGAMGQGSVIEGQRFGHVVDPRSGWPLREPRQALVVARDATEAEVLSTALLVLGPREGIALLESRPGCEGLLLTADGGRFETSDFRDSARFEDGTP